VKDEVIISVALRTGVALAALCSAVGALTYFGHGGATPDYAVFHAAHVAPAMSGLGLMALGVIVLSATPLVRVALLIFVFARERDGLYATISAVVLAVLILGLNA
jgi:uncharacterized membrane protein